MQPQRYLCRKSKLASECAPLFTYLLAFPHLAVSNSYLIYTTTLRTSQDLVLVSRPIKTTFLRSWSWSWSRPCWSWSWSWSQPLWSWSWSRSRPVWSWSWSWSRPVWSWCGLGLGLPGLDNISGNFTVRLADICSPSFTLAYTDCCVLISCTEHSTGAPVH